MNRTTIKKIVSRGGTANTVKIIILAVIIAASGSYIFAHTYEDWSAPDCGPTGCNRHAPLNTGPVSQVKESGLSVDALTVFGNEYVSGWLGVGKTPERPLDVLGKAQFHRNNNSVVGLLVSQEGGGDVGVSLILTGVRAWMFGIDNSDQDKFKIADRQTASWAGTRLTIQTNGDVGIGTTNPSTRLEVAGGAIKATGGLIIETRSDSDPSNPATGQMWLRTDI